MRTLIIDASIILAWFLPDENSPLAESIRQDFLVKKIKILVPTILLYETINGVRSALLQKRVNKAESNQLVSNVLHALPEFSDFAELAKEAFKLSDRYSISIYDASYVTLSQKMKLPFYTADRKLFEKIKKLPGMHWVGEYKSQEKL